MAVPRPLGRGRLRCLSYARQSFAPRTRKSKCLPYARQSRRHLLQELARFARPRVLSHEMHLYVCIMHVLCMYYVCMHVLMHACMQTGAPPETGGRSRPMSGSKDKGRGKSIERIGSERGAVGDLHLDQVLLDLRFHGNVTAWGALWRVCYTYFRLYLCMFSSTRTN